VSWRLRESTEPLLRFLRWHIEGHSEASFTFLIVGGVSCVISSPAFHGSLSIRGSTEIGGLIELAMRLHFRVHSSTYATRPADSDFPYYLERRELLSSEKRHKIEISVCDASEATQRLDFGLHYPERWLRDAFPGPLIEDASWIGFG